MIWFFSLRVSFYSVALQIYSQCTQTPMPAHTWQAWAICKALAKKGNRKRKLSRWGTALGGKSAGCEHPLSFLSRLGTQPTLQSCHVRRSALEKRERKAGWGKASVEDERRMLAAMRKLHFPRKSTQPEDIFRWHWQLSAVDGDGLMVDGWGGGGFLPFQVGPLCPCVCVWVC